jgi:hypothetical protein
MEFRHIKESAIEQKIEYKICILLCKFPFETVRIRKEESGERVMKKTRFRDGRASVKGVTRYWLEVYFDVRN